MEQLPTWMILLAAVPLLAAVVLRRFDRRSRIVDALAMLAIGVGVIVAILAMPERAVKAATIIGVTAVWGVAVLAVGVGAESLAGLIPRRSRHRARPRPARAPAGASRPA